jgi:hypothetical protein
MPTIQAVADSVRTVGSGRAGVGGIGVGGGSVGAISTVGISVGTSVAGIDSGVGASGVASCAKALLVAKARHIREAITSWKWLLKTKPFVSTVVMTQAIIQWRRVGREQPSRNLDNYAIAIE